MRQFLIASLLLTSASAFADPECAFSANEFPNKPALVAAFGGKNPFTKWKGPFSMASIGPNDDKNGTYIELGAMARKGAQAALATASDEKIKATVSEMLATVEKSPNSRAPFNFHVCVDADKKPYLDQLGTKTYFSDDFNTLQIAMPGMPKATFTRADDTAAAK